MLHPTFPQVSQIGVSACGATAVINALLALDSPHTTATVAAQGRAADDVRVHSHVIKTLQSVAKNTPWIIIN